MGSKVIRLETRLQRLQLVPQLGGGIADWDWKTIHGWTPLLRPWDGVSDDPWNLACFPILPWIHRMTGGSFDHEGSSYQVPPNRDDEDTPVHGDGWLQPWQVTGQTEDSISLTLESHRFRGNPFEYRCTQTFALLPDGLTAELMLTHLGDRSMPYGLGLHPYFIWNGLTRLRFHADGVWLVGDDGSLTAHTQIMPHTWDYKQPEPLDGPLISNSFSGWDGEAAIAWPDRDLTLKMVVDNCPGFVLLYRQPGSDYFALAPITQPADALSMDNRPGLAVLAKNQSMSLKVRFQVAITG